MTDEERRQHNVSLTAGQDDWTARAACLGMDTELFYSDGAAQIAESKRVCASCPVQVACLAFAIKAEGGPITSGQYSGRFGVFGGMTAKERAAYVRAREKEQVA
jgi:WhiB family redox-sensing transcriptional regulator